MLLQLQGNIRPNQPAIGWNRLVGGFDAG